MMRAEEIAQRRRQQNYGYGDPLELGGGEKPDDQGPDQIELLFDGERPGDAERAGRLLRDGDKKVLQKEWISPAGRGSFKNRVGLQRIEVRNNHKHENQQAVVKRPNP